MGVIESFSSKERFSGFYYIIFIIQKYRGNLSHSRSQKSQPMDEENKVLDRDPNLYCVILDLQGNFLTSVDLADACLHISI